MNGFINLTQTNNREINNLGIQLNYNGSTGELEVSLMYRDAVINTVKVDLPLELLISSGYYNSANKELVLVLANNETISIPVADLVDEYYADNTTVELIDVNGKQTFRVKKGSISKDYLTTDVWNNIASSENTSNRINEINTQTNTDTTYPSTRAVVNYVDSKIITALNTEV